MASTKRQPIVLSKRLETVAALIPADTRILADIGYDHGKLIRELVISRERLRVIGVELLPHYASAFWNNHLLRAEGVRSRIDLRQGSGLARLQPGEADCLVLTGMGETRIGNILHAAPAQLAGVRSMVLGPSHYFIKLRETLSSLGFYTAMERLVQERGRYYHIVLAVPGRDPAEGELVWRYAPRLFESRHPGLQEYLIRMQQYLAVRQRHLPRQTPAMQAYLKDLDAAISLAGDFCGCE